MAYNSNYNSKPSYNKQYNSNSQVQTAQVQVDIPKDLANAEASQLVEISEKLGKSFTGIKTNQIRNVYAQIALARTEMQKGTEPKSVIRELILMKPKLAYAAGRQNVVKPFKEYLDKIIDAVINSSDTQKALENFFSLVEGIVAYHKFYGGDK